MVKYYNCHFFSITFISSNSNKIKRNFLRLSFWKLPGAVA